MGVYRLPPGPVAGVIAVPYRNTILLYRFYIRSFSASPQTSRQTSQASRQTCPGLPSGLLMSPSSPGRAALKPLERGAEHNQSHQHHQHRIPGQPVSRSQAARPETKLRSHRNHQQHDPGAPGQLERHETPDPVRSNAVKSWFHDVRVCAAGVRARCRARRTGRRARRVGGRGARPRPARAACPSRARGCQGRDRCPAVRLARRRRGPAPPRARRAARPAGRPRR